MTFEKEPNMSVPYWEKGQGEDIVVSSVEGCLETDVNF
jgi:hypothetical protein